MNYTADQRRKLWGILVSLALAITVAIVLDCLPMVSEPPMDTLDSSGEVTDTVIESPVISEPVTDETEPDFTEIPESTDTPETTAPDTDAPVQDTSFVLTFLGECAPGSPLGTSSFGSYNALANENGFGYSFSQISSILSEDDLTVAANSCIFTDNNTMASVIACAAPSANAEIYKTGSVDFLSLAAPILSEYSDSSIDDTRSSLDNASIQYAEDGQITYFENAGIRLAIVCLQLTKNLNTADDVAVIRQAKESAEYVIVYFWGGDNGSHTPEEWLTATLRSFADAGASLLVGSGNGVLRPMEQYGSSTIAYSLGTLLDGAAIYHDNATVLLQLSLTKDDQGVLNTDIRLIPCYVYQNIWQPCLVSDAEDEKLITAFLSGQAASPTEK